MLLCLVNVVLKTRILLTEFMRHYGIVFVEISSFNFHLKKPMKSKELLEAGHLNSLLILTISNSLFFTRFEKIKKYEGLMQPFPESLIQFRTKIVPKIFR